MFVCKGTRFDACWLMHFAVMYNAVSAVIADLHGA